MTIRLALKAMGYHEAKPKKWLKPVGFHLFTFSEEQNLWENWFIGADREIYVFSRHTLDLAEVEYFLENLKCWEAYTRIQAGISGDLHLSVLDL